VGINFIFIVSGSWFLFNLTKYEMYPTSPILGMDGGGRNSLMTVSPRLSAVLSFDVIG